MVANAGLLTVISLLAQVQGQPAWPSSRWFLIGIVPASAMFCVMGESLIEDVVKSVIVFVLGLMLLESFTVSVSVVPGFVATSASVSNYLSKQINRARNV